MPAVIVDCRLPADYIAALKSLGFETIMLPPFCLLGSPVASHPDLLIFILDGVLITHRDYYTAARAEIDRIISIGSFRLVISNEPVGSEYPDNVLFCAAPVGNFVFARTDVISRHISEIRSCFNKTFINIRQGYSRCSILNVNDRAIITADDAIAAAARSNGIEALLIRPGHIRLDPFPSGFIGGASGRLGRTIYFCGDLGTHPDAHAIEDFCAAHGCETISLGAGELFDAGTLFFV